MIRTNLWLPALAVFAVLGAGACNDPHAHEQADQAGDAIKVAGEETAEAATAAGDAAMEDTKDAAQNAGDAMHQAGEDISDAAHEAGHDMAEAADEAGAKAEKAGDKAKMKMDDAGITAAVKSKLLADPEVKGLAIDVDTVGGKVTLSGTAKTAYEKEEAEKLARHTDGVVSVDNKIVVGGK